jgi:endoglucanase
MKSAKTYSTKAFTTITIIAFTLITHTSLFANNTNNFAPIGITLNGAEFGNNNLPGIYKKDYIYPTTEEVKYFAAKGVKMIQLPVRWERLQRTIGGELNATELQFITNFIKTCKTYQVDVIVTIQNYGRYKINNVEYPLGSKQVPYTAFRAFWKTLATNLKNYNNIYGYNLMAEPNNMGENVWGNAAQEAIYGIREVDTTHTIIVDGNSYACAEKWVEYSDELKYLEDPNNNLMYDAHCYFDEDRSGAYTNGFTNGTSTDIGVQKIAPFINWLKKNNKRGYVGEFGIPKNDARWIPVLDKFLHYIQQNGIGGCYWGAGQWWNNYSLSIEPLKGIDQPQMLVLNKYLNEQSRYAYNTAYNITKTTIK